MYSLAIIDDDADMICGIIKCVSKSDSQMRIVGSANNGLD